MIRGNTLLDNISKLNTFIHMTKSNEFLSNYIDKILNNKSKSIKFINDFDYISLDLLYTSLQIMSNENIVSHEEFNKIDKKELKYYMDKTKGINYFRHQVQGIKNEEILINYLRKALANGNYVSNHNNTIRFDNGMIADSDWIVEFANFLITSLNNNVNLSSDGVTYTFNVISLPEKQDNIKNYIKNIKLYEYNVTKQGMKKLTYQDVKYLIDTLSVIEEYDFRQLQEINSLLSKEKYTLSVNKKNVVFGKEEKAKIEKLFNEENYEPVLKEYIKDVLKCFNSHANINKRKLIDTFELIRSLSHAYKCNYSLEECRKLFDIKERKQDILTALSLANFYVNYIYDESNLLLHFNYSMLDLNDLKPMIIDYETPEYKAIITNLSSLNKRVVKVNRRINKYLESAKVKIKRDAELQKKSTENFVKDCNELDRLVKEIKELRAELSNEKDETRHESNINKTKIRYIKEAIISGKYSVSENGMMTFDCYSSRDYHHTFHLNIELNKFIEILLSDHNRNTRINFYQI